MYRVNVDNLVYALLTKDDATGVTYGTVTAVPDVQSIAMKAVTASGKAYGDGVLRKELTKLMAVEVEIELLRVPMAVRAAWLGHTVSTGTIEEDASATPPALALGFRIPHDDGKAEYVWLYKGNASPIDDSAQQSTDQLTFTNSSLKFTFIPRVKDNKIRKWGDSNEAGFTGASTWFNAVPVPA